jgi:phytoene dehydrogenase-like protein
VPGERGPTQWDAVVIGGGHNGLAAGFYLAHGGLKTLILERRDIVGGACVTEEFAPGFHASPGAYVLSMLRDGIWRDMRLARRGLRVSKAGPSLNVFPDASRLMLYGNTAANVTQMRAVSPADAAAYPRFEAHLHDLAQALIPLYDRPAPDPRLLHAEDMREAARLGRLALRHRRSLPDIAYLFAASAKQLLDETFESEYIKAALAWQSISNTLAGPSTPGTAYRLLHEAAASAGAGGGDGWGFVAGGMGVVTGLMADAAREAGATIRTGAEVERLTVRGGAAVGVTMTNGEEIRARCVLSNADPKRTFLGLVDPGDLPAEFIARIKTYKSEGASIKMNLAVSELPRIASDKGGPADAPQDYHRGLMQFTKFLGDLDKDQDLARHGTPAPAPHIEVCFPTVHDPSLAPEGTHVVTIGVRSQPYRLEGKTWDQIRDSVADEVVARLGTYLPNLPGAILHRQVLTPLDLERKFALTGGHHMHGDMSPDQLFFLRPVRGSGGYRTPVRGLYLCGAGTHPGGGVTGANGTNCARVVLKDQHRRRGK